MFGEAGAAQVQDDLQFLRLLHVLFGFLLIGTRQTACTLAASQLYRTKKNRVSHFQEARTWH
jgi:hypothetical protein